MVFVATNIKYKDIKEVKVGTASIIQSMIGGIMRAVPVGFDSYKQKQESSVLTQALENITKYEKNPELVHLIDEGYFQVGTLGGGKRKCRILLHLLSWCRKSLLQKNFSLSACTATDKNL